MNFRNLVTVIIQRFKYSDCNEFDYFICLYLFLQKMNFSQIQNNLNEINQMLDKREKEVTYSQSQPSVYTIQDGTVYTNGTVFPRPGHSNLQCRDKQRVFESF